MKNEKDPNGLDQHAPGAKVDAGKNGISFCIPYSKTASGDSSAGSADSN